MERSQKALCAMFTPLNEDMFPMKSSGARFYLTRCLTFVTLVKVYWEGEEMPTQNPRINIVLEDALYKKVQLLAEKDNVSLSAKVRDLLKVALEIQEDVVLSAMAEEREESWDESEAMSHDDVWA